MLPQIELFCVGFAAVIDTVLLLVVLERVNRPLTAVWLKSTLTGATLWHVGSFLHALLRDTDGATASQLDSLCMITMAGGLMLLNCGILHADLRISRTGHFTSSEQLAVPRRLFAIYVHHDRRVNNCGFRQPRLHRSHKRIPSALSDMANLC